MVVVLAPRLAGGWAGMGGDNLDELTAALDALSDDVVLPDGDMRANQQARDLFNAVDTLVATRRFRSHRPKDEAFTLIEDLFSKASGDQRTILMSAVLRQNDQAFLDHGADGLNVFRVDFSGHGAGLPMYELDLVPAGSGLIPKSTRPGEQAQVALYAELQVFVPSTEESPAMLEANERPVDDFGLMGGLAEHYRARVIRRVVWGSGSCLITNQRLIAVLFDDAITNRPDTGETVNMPVSTVTGEVSSAVAFTAERSQFESRQVTAGASPIGKFFYNRVPTLNLHGSKFHVVLDVRRVVDSGKIRKPGKGEVDAAVFEFCNG
jgi:hypothetical protein